MQYLVAGIPGYRHRHVGLLARNDVFPLKRCRTSDTYLKTQGRIWERERCPLAFGSRCNTALRLYSAPGILPLNNDLIERLWGCKSVRFCPAESRTAADHKWDAEDCCSISAASRAIRCVMSGFVVETKGRTNSVSTGPDRHRTTFTLTITLIPAVNHLRSMISNQKQTKKE